MAEKPQESDEEKLIKSLGVKFTDLPEDTKRSVLELLDLPAEGEMPSEKDHDLKTLDAVTKADQQEFTKEKELASMQQQETQSEHGRNLDVFNATKPEPKKATAGATK